MKKTALLLSLLISLFLPGLQAQENSARPRFTEFRTPEEFDSGGWQNKIIDEAQIDSRILQLVTSKDTAYYYNRWICVQVLDKTTRRLLQEIDLAADEEGGVGDMLCVDDYNFDGYDDFSMLEGVYASGNTSSVYFLFDPGTGTFFESNIGGTNLEFNYVSKTITSTNYCCVGSRKMEQIYKLVDNRAVLIEQHCLTMVEVEEKGTYLEDEDGYPVFEEEDCYPDSYIDVELESVGLKDTCRLRLAIYDEDMAGGFVQYKDQKERIPLHLNHSQTVEPGSGGGPDTRRLFYNEMRQGVADGEYVVTLRYPDVIEVYYLRGKEEREFMLKKTTE
ncbi:hypothetical protein [uncultured Alistipes sp.]|uniref:XAC2610-related protein n=1 Tax=uncultured Alistipes sp. TaxID=538949 RepID=UPI00258C7F97|nr:hypothetical protein [uncultured Alistipes sp.]